jgi:PAS domain-containing protein
LIVRFWLLPVEAGLAFITFYPAIVIIFYLCGTGPGARAATLAAAGYYTFLPHSGAFASDPGGGVTVGIFLLSAALIGLVIQQLHALAVDAEKNTDAVRQTEELYRSVPEDLTEIICRYKADGTIIYVNDAYCRLFGKPREALATPMRRHAMSLK